MSEQAMPNTNCYKAVLEHLHLYSKCKEFCNIQAYLKRLLLDELTDMHDISTFIFAVTCADLPPLTPSLHHQLDLRLFCGYTSPYPCTALHKGVFLEVNIKICFKKGTVHLFQVQASPRIRKT